MKNDKGLMHLLHSRSCPKLNNLWWAQGLCRFIPGKPLHARRWRCAAADALASAASLPPLLLACCGSLGPGSEPSCIPTDGTLAARAEAAFAASSADAPASPGLTAAMAAAAAASMMRCASWLKARMVAAATASLRSWLLHVNLHACQHVRCTAWAMQSSM